MTDVLPPEYFYNPEFFDYMLIVPVWMWIIIGMIFLGFVAFIAMIYIWLIMRPVSGYGALGDTSTAKGAPTQVFSIWKNRSFVIESLWYYGNVLAYANPVQKMQMWFHNSEKATGVSAGKPVMITRDGYDGTVDFVAEMAVCEIPKIFNRDWGFELVPRTDINGRVVIGEDGTPVMEERERKDANGESYILSSFADIRKRMKLLEKLYPDGIPIPIYQLYDLATVYQFTPQGQDSLEFGGVLVDDAQEWLRDNEEEKPGWFERNSLLLICLIVGIVSTAFVYMAFPVK